MYLTNKEVIFLNMLLKNKVVTYELMIKNMWDGSSNVTQNSLTLFVKNFRKKTPPKSIKNLHGIGYKIENNIIYRYKE